MSFFSKKLAKQSPTSARELVSQLITASRVGKAEDVASLMASPILAELPERARSDTLAVGLYEAASEGHIDIVRTLAWAGATLDRPYPIDGNTALIIAAFTGRDEVVKFLAAYGADVNARNQSGLTPLMLAAGRCDSSTVEELIRVGANVSAKTPDLLDACTFAECEGKHETLRLLRYHMQGS